MKKIPLTFNKYALVDDKDYLKVSKYSWSYDGTYAITKYKCKKTNKRKTLRMHRLIAKTPLGMQTDHINGNGIDNRRKNLRVCSNQQNCWNRKLLEKNKTSKYRGVCYIQRRKKFCASIRVDNKSVHLGYFKSEKIAAMAYNIAAKISFGKFSNLNRVSL